jgi:anthranilate synthase component 1
MLTVVRQLPADLETPVSVYLKLAGSGPSFLLESVTGGEQIARYSFIGVQPRAIYILRDGILEKRSQEKRELFPVSPGNDPLDLLRAELSQYRPAAKPGLPRLIGGLVGYLGYDTVPYFEPAVPLAETTAADIPDAIFLLADTIVAFDHAYGNVLLITNVFVEGDENLAQVEANARLDSLVSKIQSKLPDVRTTHKTVGSKELNSTLAHAEFIEAVQQAKEHIAAGDIFQVVLSQRFNRQTSAKPFDIYRALRRVNPSPYMFFFDFGMETTPQPFYLIGASPEMHVRLTEGTAFLRPIAGTRPRGATQAEDSNLDAELLADPKERAEHVMLVDLGRNDLGRVCKYGSVKVSDLMKVEYYSHVMHIVSSIQGELREGLDAFDLVKATFPAGTVTGAPKIRAMQIIAALEKERRGPYAGAAGYFSLDGSMDTCISIRTLVMLGSQVSIQAGAGIVADSDPEKEYSETISKARALAAAVENAEKEFYAGGLSR